MLLKERVCACGRVCAATLRAGVCALARTCVCVCVRARAHITPPHHTHFADQRANRACALCRYERELRKLRAELQRRSKELVDKRALLEVSRGACLAQAAARQNVAR